MNKSCNMLIYFLFLVAYYCTSLLTTTIPQVKRVYCHISPVGSKNILYMKQKKEGVGGGSVC